MTSIEKEQLSLNPDFWNDPKDAETVLKAIKRNKKWVANFNELATALNDLEALFEFFQEGSLRLFFTAFPAMQFYDTIKKLKLRNSIDF